MSDSSLERVAIFFDGENLFYAVRDGLKVDRRVDIDLLARKLADNRKLTRIYYYTTLAPDNSEPPGRRQQFLEAIGWIENLEKRLGRLLRRTKRVRCPGCNNEFDHQFLIQKGVDTRIVLDMWRLAHLNWYDTAILVCGDEDLAETVKAIKEHTNKRVENAFVQWNGWAKPLREAADKRIPLTKEYLEDCWLKGK